MSQLSRICLATGLVAGMAFLGYAADGDDLGARKEQVIRSSLGLLGDAAAENSVLDAAAKADALLDIRTDASGPQPAVRLRTAGTPPYKCFTDDGGRKVVLDLYDTVNLCTRKPVAPCALIEGVRTSLFRLEPRIISRLVIDLEAPCAYEVVQEPRAIALVLRPAESARPQPAPAPALQAKTTSLLSDLSTLQQQARVQTTVDRVADDLAAVRASTEAADPLERVEMFPLTVAPVPQVAYAAVTEGALAVSEAADAPAGPAAEQTAPPPPEKRPDDAAARAAGPPVVVKMKQVLTDLASSAAHAASEGVTASGADAAAPAQPAEPAPKPSKEVEPVTTTYTGDPMQQVVNIDFREMELSNVVALLAQKAGINVIAGADLTGVVTANLRNVTLRRAMDTVLRMNGLGMLEEEGIYHIVPYAEAMAAKRVTTMVRLDNAKADSVKKTLEDILRGAPEDTLTSISTNTTTNMVVIAGPEARVAELKKLAMELDVAQPVTPTVTEAIKINNAEPAELATLVKGMLSDQIGKVATDERSRHLVVTDVPVVLEQVRALIQQVDMPVKQVSIETMIVDAVLSDNAETGVDWIVNSVREVNRRGQIIGSLQELGLESDATADVNTPGIIGSVPLAGRLMLGVLSDDIDLRGVIAAEVRTQKAKLLANPVVVTVENKKAMINITQEIPYQEFTQSLTGPPVATTNFKDIGIIVEVTPRVTHDDHIIAELSAKQSDTKGQLNNIPIEDKRQTMTTLRTKNGQTIFIGGLRRFDDQTQVKKVPVLGDLPVMNFMFRRNLVEKESTELLVFLTCNVLADEIEPLSAPLQASYDEVESTSRVPDAERQWGESILCPTRTYDDPNWKWRRAK